MELATSPPVSTHDNKDEAQKGRYCTCRNAAIGLVTAVGVAIIIWAVLFVGGKGREGDSEIDTQEYPFRCPKKRITISHICNILDLDDDVFGRDVTMDIKVLIGGELYWPQNATEDCNEIYGSYDGSCVIPDTLLTGCFELTNNIEWAIDGEPTSDLKVTIYDEDLFSDDYIDIVLPKDQWYFGNECDKFTQVINSTARSAFFHMTVTSEIAPPSATNAPVVVPSPAPTTVDSDNADNTAISPVFKSLEECGVPLTNLTDALSQASDQVIAMQQVLADYTNLDTDGRHLLWGALVSGVKAFTQFAGRKGVEQGPLSTLADFCTIGSTLFSHVFGGGGAPEDSGPDVEALFDAVHERFDDIDYQLDDIQNLVKDGFEALEVVIKEQFANKELDEWINVHLGVLADDYRAYTHVDHTPASRRGYEDTFRNSCQKLHSPFTTFKALYSHTCRECDKLDGKSNLYILDTFIALANDNYDTIPDRIRWFRQSFGQLMMGAMVEAFYLHAVCLYHPDDGADDVCQNQDPVWLERLATMSDAMEEVAESLSRAEERLKCYRKRVRISHICNLKDDSPCNLPWQGNDESKNPSIMDISVKMDDRKYWPRDAERDCPAGNIWDTCKVADSLVVNKCYALKNGIQQMFTSRKTLKINVRDDCRWSTFTKATLNVPASQWYGDEYQCGIKSIEVSNDDGEKVKLEIESVPLG